MPITKRTTLIARTAAIAERVSSASISTSPFNVVGGSKVSVVVFPCNFNKPHEGPGLRKFQPGENFFLELLRVGDGRFPIKLKRVIVGKGDAELSGSVDL